MNRLQLLLLKLGEECNEVAQIASKCSQFGLNEIYSGMTDDRRADGLSNRHRLHLELNDLNAMVMMLNKEFDLGYSRDIGAVLKKIEKVNLYAGYSADLGLVEANTTDKQE